MRTPLVPQFIRDRLRPAYRSIRSRYLRVRYPEGGFLSCHGVEVFCDFSHPSYSWYDSNSVLVRFDLNVLAWLMKRAQGSLFVDLGAHFGLFAAAMVRVLERERRPGRVLAVEPDSRNYRCVERTLTKLECSNVRPIWAAIGEVDGLITMHDSNASCLHTYPTADSQPLYDVPCVTLPTLLAQEGGGSKLALIKIDVDGAEPAFFAGALSVLMRDKPLVITEFAPTSLRDAGRDPYEFFKFLSSRFVVYWLQIQQWPLRRVAVEDFQEIIEQVGPAVTDLILSPAALPVDETLAAVF